METIILSFNIISPLMLLLIIGYFMKKQKIIAQQTITEMNHLVFMLLLPMNLFKNIYHSDFTTDFNPQLIIFCIAALLISILFIIVIVLSMVKDPSKRAAIIQASFRGNFVIFGLPLATSLYGDAVTGMISIVIAFVVPISNVLAVLCLEIFNNAKLELKTVMIDVLKNPMIIASAIAIIFVTARIQIPVFLDESISMISDATTTLSLLILGTSFHFHHDHEDLKMIALGVINKLILFPAVIIIAAILLGFRNAQLVVVLCLFTAPVAVSCFPMAAKLGADKELTSGIVVYTYVFGALTICTFIYTLKTLNLI